jgi:CubicO group peptidase (beta-lactamase class C family)
LGAHAVVFHHQAGRAVDQAGGHAHVFGLVFERFFEFGQRRLKALGGVFGGFRVLGSLGIGGGLGRFGLGVGVLKDPVAYGQLGSAGQFGWSGYATTTVIIDPKESMVAMYFEQVIPEGFALLSDWTNLVYQSIAD